MAALRVGVIGLGFIGTAKHLPGLASLGDEVQIVAFCDLEIERAEGARANYGAEGSYATTDWRQVVADESLDVVHVCTWNTTHCEITVAALEAGKHVLVEKPMAVTGAEARLMAATAERVGRKLTVGYQYRFRQDSQYVRATVDEGRLGEIYHARAHAVRRRGVPVWGCFMDKSKQGGGPLIDLGTHALDLALWFMGDHEVASVTGSVYSKLRDKPEGNIGMPWDPARFEVEDSAFGLVTMKSGATVFLEAAWALNVKASREACVTLMGTEGGADTEQVGGEYEATLNGVAGGKLYELRPTLDAGYFGASGEAPSGFAVMGAAEARQWVDAIRHDTDPLVLPAQAAVVTEVLEAIYRSSETGAPVVFS